MFRNTLAVSLIISLYVTSCSTRLEQAQSNADPKAQEIVDKAIAKHGGAAYESAAVGFDFREKHYTVQRFPDRYVYTRSWQDSIGYVEDVLVNSTRLTRTVDGDTVELTDEWAFKYANSVNSVFYFALLPYGLNDAAVIKKYLGEVTIKGKPYHKVQITFQQEGGGKDFEDVFIYWFDKDTYQLDYLAYYYNTDETGIRFREAYNRQTVDGILFQDYVNYEPIDSTITVHQTDEQLEKGLLKELSRIENEKLESLK
ncbi:DUF6503 family protein [Imperialibacter roseus]|uniref:DUF6503 family protein n=1 Tax=Imperialibacter roseus TaxID=1324217 RepID=A0ABZ0IRB8_9BACT|nr:DUF6503 family protein [Imperialibacter roseus]WOK06905.1 DUF6503 family protein [Imperialibacter roseus]